MIVENTYWISIIRKYFSNTLCEQSSTSYLLQEIYRKREQDPNHDGHESICGFLVVEIDRQLFTPLD